MRLSLRAGERIYVNGAVIRVDRKVSLELMNDVVFLLEAHVLQPEDTTTPLKQLYFVLQSILIDPINSAATTTLFHNLHASTLASFANETVVVGLTLVREQLDAGRAFDALKTLRGLFPVEAVILGTAPDAPTTKAA
jgi:flagellar protein FlbT